MRSLCKFCGKEFIPYLHSQGRFCSNVCSAKFREGKRRNSKYKPGTRIGKKLTVIHETRREKKGKIWAYWFLCKCDCGNEIEIASYNMTRTLSCGCLVTRAGGDSTTRSPYYKLYWAWCWMRKRVTLGQYKEKGINVCQEWQEYLPFKTWASKVGWEIGLRIDRIDPDKDYCPENCQWITQSKNAARVPFTNAITKVKKYAEQCTDREYERLLQSLSEARLMHDSMR